MPRARARSVIICANRRSSPPPSSSPSAAAASLADLVTKPMMACSTVSAVPGINPSLVGGMADAAALTGTIVSTDTRRSRNASNVMYSVISLVRLAG